ncbi:MAG TPA: penicillin-binding transpeptidase domain-containing protein, partial [Kofleriaceae bacterium]|nr:penicillin-binding transpeptidase domain-containing protein [Kofleriaceae bacterium]
GSVSLLRRAPAALKASVLASALAAVRVMPALVAVVPAWHVESVGAAPGLVAPAPALPVAEAGSHAAVAHPAVAGAASAPSWHVPWGALLVLAWALGAAAIAARAGVGALRARGIARRGVLAERAYAVADDVWRTIGGRGATPRIVTSGEIDAPIVVGAMAPVVVVPAASVAWSAERWRVVLAHELSHVRRRDGLANAIAQVACAVHWIDPLVWLAARRLREEREVAADDTVLRGGTLASTYAEHLIAIATASPAPAGAIGMTDGARFEARIEGLLARRRSHAAAGVPRTLAVVALMATVAAVAACVAPDAAARPAAKAAPVKPTDARLQAAAEKELDAVLAADHASGAVAVVIDAKSGAVLAVASRGDGDARAARVPGSTLKPFTIAAALDAGVITPDTKVDCEHGEKAYGDKVLHDASPNGVLDVGGVLVVSSNVCAAKLAEPLGDKLADSLRRYHFAAPAHIDTRSWQGAAISAGEGIDVSPLDLAAAYTVFATAGMYRAPDGTSERVMTDQTARQVLGMLERVVTDADGTGHAAAIDGVKVAGKTGTAHSHGETYYASFVGIVPADAPRFVVLVGVDGTSQSGGQVAAPVFARLAARALAGP